jgi:hypothetical protein
MPEDLFVADHSIVRKIWGHSDTILLIFSGAAAEFALNKAVDWLYYTGKLPADPIGRLFSTVDYSKKIVFATTSAAHKAIDQLRMIHHQLETARGYAIPDWAYRDVLFMLIHYSIASYQILFRQMTWAEKQEVYDVFYRMGIRMGLQNLPPHYIEWLPVRQQHLAENLVKSRFTTDLFLQYRRQLGEFRYFLLLESQKLVIPMTVRKWLGMGRFSWLIPLLPFYKLLRRWNGDALIKKIVFSGPYADSIKKLEQLPAHGFYTTNT